MEYYLIKDYTSKCKPSAKQPKQKPISGYKLFRDTMPQDGTYMCMPDPVRYTLRDNEGHYRHVTFTPEFAGRYFSGDINVRWRHDGWFLPEYFKPGCRLERHIGDYRIVGYMDWEVEL